MAYVLPEYEKQDTVKQPVKDNGGGGLRIGSSGEDVKKLQNALIERNYLESGGADGQYGPKTEAAVRKYQTDNKLQVDGIAGNETLGHLYGTASTGGTAADTSANTAPATKTPLQKAQELLDQQLQTKPSYNDTWSDMLKESMEQYTNRDKFSYDPNQDALYKQLQDQYVAQGQLAMMDAQGQAAALAGGYGTSYGQMVGQQTYQNYLQQITDKIPQLYELARANYDAEGQELLNKISMIGTMSDREYNRYMNELNTWLSERDYLQGVVDNERNWEQNEFNNLSSLISMGYEPTDEELMAAGMTRGQADTIFNQYAASKYSGGTGKGSQQTQINYERLGYSNYNEFAEDMAEKYAQLNANGEPGEALYKYLSGLVANGEITETQLENIYDAAAASYVPNVDNGIAENDGNNKVEDEQKLKWWERFIEAAKNK